MTVDTACPATPGPHRASSGLHSRQAAQRRCPEHIQQQLVHWLAAGELCSCQAALRDQGAGAAAAAEGGIRGTDVLVILCRTS